MVEMGNGKDEKIAEMGNGRQNAHLRTYPGGQESEWVNG